MPMYEIVAHLRCELEGDTAEDAAALFRRRVVRETGVADELLHLAVWRQDQQSAVSALPEALRQQLREFFVALDRCASEAEEDFRERVGAILADAGSDGGNAAVTPPVPMRTERTSESRERSS